MCAMTATSASRKARVGRERSCERGAWVEKETATSASRKARAGREPKRLKSLVAVQQFDACNFDDVVVIEF